MKFYVKTVLVMISLTCCIGCGKTAETSADTAGSENTSDEASQTGETDTSSDDTSGEASQTDAADEVSGDTARTVGTEYDFKAVSVVTDDEDMTITEGEDIRFKGTAKVTFPDGSEKDNAKVSWYDETGNLTVSTGALTEGTHKLTGRISYFDNPIIPQRADPYVIYNEDDGYYYFTSSWPAYKDAEHGYDRIVLRKSRTLEGLADAEDQVIWNAHESGEQSHHIWAPELHKIGDNWYVYYAANSDNDIWSIRPWVLECTDASRLTDPEAWTEKGRFVNKDGNYRGSFDAFSLDMTTFEHDGKQYVIWAYKTNASMLLLAEIDPEKPWQLTTDPILLSKPEYDWEMVNEIVNEGPAVLKHDGKIYVAYSASATGPEYCVGLLSADEKSDLMDISSWTKSDTPVLQTSDFTDQYGPGHNSFTVDENGNTMIVYHSRDQKCYDDECEWADCNPLYDPCRNANLAYVRFADDGTPVFNSTPEKETDGLDIELTVTVKPSGR